MIQFLHRHPVLAWILSCILTFVIMIGFMFIGFSDLVSMASYVVIDLMLCFFLYAISGKRTFAHMNDRIGYVLRRGLPILVFPLLFCAIGLAFCIASGTPVKAAWPVSLLQTVVLFFLVGICEELGYRAIACDALLPRLKNTKHPFLYTAIISGAAFGLVHVIFDGASGWLGLLLALLKVLTTAVFGASLMILYWKTRNVLAIGILHGLYDLLPSLTDCFFVVEQAEESTGFTGGDISSAVVYLIQLAVELIILRVIYKKVGKTIDYPRTLEEWEA